MLRTFEINGFRTFSHLRVEKLGRVNLVTGKNNVGKTTLLEALRLFAQVGQPVAIWQILREREELIIDSSSDEEHIAIETLFHGRGVNGDICRELSLGPIGPDESRLTVSLEFLRKVPDETSSTGTIYRFEPDTADAPDYPNRVPCIVVKAKSIHRIFPISEFDRYPRRLRSFRSFDPAFIPANGAGKTEVARWWDSISLTDSETRVVECLNVLAPVERVSLVEHPTSRGDRIFKARMQGQRSPIPLKSLGDGVLRMFQIALAVEYTSSSSRSNEQRLLFPELLKGEAVSEPFLFIDEAENGIHYTALRRFWQFIFRVARQRGVQVFATTHSWDCIESFQAAAQADSGCDAMLIRLEQKDKLTRAVLFDEAELPVVARERIEVR